MRYDLGGKIALVTGATSGIGRAAALALSRAGAKVVFSGRREPEGEETLAQIRAVGGEASFVRSDAGRADDIAALVAHVVGRYERLDIAFNNAGIEGALVPITELEESAIDEMLSVSVKGVLLAMKHEMRQMVRQGGGVIVNSSSVFGAAAFPNLSLYVAAKHAINGMTKVAALEGAKAGVRVNAVAPGPVDTPMMMRFTGNRPEAVASLTAMGRVARPEEIADAVLWLASDGSSYATGQVVVVDGGFSLA